MSSISDHDVIEAIRYDRASDASLRPNPDGLTWDVVAADGSALATELRRSEAEGVRAAHCGRAFRALIGRRKLAMRASDYLRVDDYRAADGSCRLCGQAAITGHHNCDGLRLLASVGKSAKSAAVARKRATCKHEGDLEIISHEESRCKLCGAYLFTPDL